MNYGVGGIARGTAGSGTNVQRGPDASASNPSGRSAFLPKAPDGYHVQIDERDYGREGVAKVTHMSSGRRKYVPFVPSNDRLLDERRRFWLAAQEATDIAVEILRREERERTAIEVMQKNHQIELGEAAWKALTKIDERAQREMDKVLYHGLMYGTGAGKLTQAPAEKKLGRRDPRLLL